MRKMMITALMAVTGAVLQAALPTITNIGLSQNADTRLVTVTYTLNGDTPAIVTPEFLTNGVSVGVNVGALFGDISRVVTPTGGVSTFYWQPTVTIPDTVLDANTLSVKLTVWDLASPPDYMAVNLLVTNSIAFYPSAEAVPGGVANRLYKTDVLLMRKIPAAGAEFMMGTPTNWFSNAGRVELGRSPVEHLPHQVALTNDYYMGIYELTYRQFRNVLKRDPGWYNSSIWPGDADRDVHPLGGFRYHQWRSRSDTAGSVLKNMTNGVAEIGWPRSGHQIATNNNPYLNTFRNLTGLEFDLPTEAQWEYACRAGSQYALYTDEELYYTAVTNLSLTEGKTIGSTVKQIIADGENEITNTFKVFNLSTNLDAIAWYAGNWAKDPHAVCMTTGIPLPHEVGLLKPNAFGLYDMLGNVYECCLNRMDLNGNVSSGADVIEPVGPDAANPSVQRAIRGGAYNCEAFACRAGHRCSLGIYYFGTRSGSQNAEDNSVTSFLNTYGEGDPNASGSDAHLYSGAGPNIGVRLVCPAVIPAAAPGAEEEGPEETTEGGN